MQLEITQTQEWELLKFPGRIDALNFGDFAQALDLQVQRDKALALDLRQVQFLNIHAIRYIHHVAEEIVQKGARLALVGPTEKMKRQFSLFASLKPFRVFSSSEWDRQPQSQGVSGSL